MSVNLNYIRLVPKIIVKIVLNVPTAYIIYFGYKGLKYANREIHEGKQRPNGFSVYNSETGKYVNLILLSYSGNRKGYSDNV